MWAEGAFVFHGLTVGDEVAHVEPLETATAGVLQFLKNRPCTQPGLSPFRCMVEVDAAQAAFGDIHQAQSDQLSGVTVLKLAGE